MGTKSTSGELCSSPLGAAFRVAGRDNVQAASDPPVAPEGTRPREQEGTSEPDGS